MSSPLRNCIAPSTCALSLFADRPDAVKKGAVPHKNHLWKILDSNRKDEVENLQLLHSQRFICRME